MYLVVFDLWSIPHDQNRVRSPIILYCWIPDFRNLHSFRFWLLEDCLPLPINTIISYYLAVWRELSIYLCACDQAPRSLWGKNRLYRIFVAKNFKENERSAVKKLNDNLQKWVKLKESQYHFGSRCEGAARTKRVLTMRKQITFTHLQSLRSFRWKNPHFIFNALNSIKVFLLKVIGKCSFISHRFAKNHTDVVGKFQEN